MSTTLTATSKAVAEWTRVFPQVTGTYTSSVAFMKQLTVVAVSMITYKKNIFPKESYINEQLGGLRVKILKKKCEDELAQFVSTSLIQALEAFDKKYLHQLALCFNAGECHADDDLIEYHMFEFTYNSKGATMGIHSKSRDTENHSAQYTFKNIQERTLHLIQSCEFITQMCQSKLPESFDINLRLYYNDEYLVMRWYLPRRALAEESYHLVNYYYLWYIDAPEGYQAPGFAPGDAAAGLPRAGPARSVVGWAETPFHRLVARSYFGNDVVSSQDANPSLTTPVMTQNEGEEVWSERESPGGSGGEPRVRCPCNKTDCDDLELLTCEYCGWQQHALCFGVRVAASVSGHCCTTCSDERPARAPTDPRLAELHHTKREFDRSARYLHITCGQSLCVVRVALAWCGGRRRASAASLSRALGLAPRAADQLLHMLRAEGVVRGDGPSFASQQEIIPEQLEILSRQFFQCEKTDMVDRLFAEAMSQENCPDPVGEALGPTEKVNLHNATTMGKIVEHTPPDTVVDSTMKQYRESVLSSDQQMDEDLPLSGSHNPVTDMKNIGKKAIKKKMTGPEDGKLGVKTKRAKITAE